MNYVTPFLFSFSIAIILTGLCRKIGLTFGFVSKPRARDVHKKPIPRIGGVAIFLAFLIVSLAIFLASKWSRSDSLALDDHLIGIWVGGGLISLSMLLDDLFGLKAWQKFLFQFLVVFVVIASGIGIDILSNPFGEPINLNSVYIPLLTYHGIIYHFSLWSDLLTLIWLVGMMNIINFVDGVDGLAAGVSLIASTTIFLLSIGITVNQPQTAMVAAILAGSAAGFLVWNFPPAKIFMGDSGSMFLGFMLGTLALMSGGKLATTFLVLGFPIVDGLVVVLGRLRRKENPFTTPDKTHLHHRFLAAGFSQREAVLSLYLIAILFAWVALRSTTLDKMVAAIVLVILVFVLTRVLNNQIKKSKIKNKNYS